jgi:putative ABC transport system substrate-binding protein
LRALGWEHGRNLVYVPRSAEGRFERLAQILAEVVDHGVDVIVAPGDEIPQRAKAITRTVPFVMMSFTDPVKLGLAASLARPGGNFTGLTRATSADIEGKRLELLREVLPQLSRVS